MKKIKVIIFIVALIIGIGFAKVFGFSLGFNLPSFSFCSGERGSGVSKIEKRDLANFKQIEVSGIINVEATAQKDFSVDVEADDNLLEFIQTEVQGDTLKISTKKNLSPKTKIRIVIAMPDVTGLEVSGVSKATVNDVQTENFTLNVSGASKIEINGQADNLNIDSSGASKIDAENLQVAKADINVSGASKITVNATEELKADVSGAGKVSYIGEPKNIIKDISGAGKVSQK